jgi:hypothetical protein
MPLLRKLSILLDDPGALVFGLEVSEVRRQLED